MNHTTMVSCWCLIGLSAVLNGFSPCMASELPVTLQTEAEKVAEARIVAALAEPVTWDFDETTLGEFVEFLASQLDVPVVIGIQDLRNVGLDCDVPITFAVSGITGKSALELILNKIGLTWIVHNEVLFITTPKATKDHLISKIYDVRDLVTFVDDQMEEHYDFQSLIDIITGTLASETWNRLGGIGSIESFQATGLDVLVVTQTREVHEEVDLLLKKLHAAQNEEALERGPRPAIEPAPRPAFRGGHF